MAVAVAAALTASAAPAADAPVALPEIALTPGNGSLRIEGFVTGSGGAEATAALSIVHRGSGGSMNTRQASPVRLDAGTRSRVASTTLNFGPQSVLTVELTITMGDTVIASSRTVVGAER